MILRDVSLDQQLVERLAGQLHHDDESPVGGDARHAEEMDAVRVVYVVHRHHLLIGRDALLLQDLAGDVLTLVVAAIDEEGRRYPT